MLMWNHRAVVCPIEDDEAILEHFHRQGQSLESAELQLKVHLTHGSGKLIHPLFDELLVRPKSSRSRLRKLARLVVS
jgi:hypothetical protein